MPLQRLMSDEALLQELGHRIARLRLERNLSQAQLAEQAGISKRTLERLEAGAAATQLSLFLRVLRQLDLLERLELLLPEPQPSPLAPAGAAEAHAPARQPPPRRQARHRLELGAAMTVAAVELWGTRIGAVALTDSSGVAAFEYDPAFLASGIRVGSPDDAAGGAGRSPANDRCGWGTSAGGRQGQGVDRLEPQHR
jgi:Predicted transcriptional regulator with C-terminal CBS domains